MNKNTHPNSERIIAFIENPDLSEFTDIKLHLAFCTDCRHKASQLNQLQSELQDIRFIQKKTHYDKTIQEAPELQVALIENKIEDYVDCKLDKNEYNSINNLIQENPQALKAALHYAGHQSAMRRELGKEKSGIKFKINNIKSTLFKFLQSVLTVKTPTWILVPATGLASIVIVIR